MVMDLILNMAEIVRNHEKEVMNLAEETNTRLDQALALGRLQNLAAQVLLFFKNKIQTGLSLTLASLSLSAYHSLIDRERRKRAVSSQILFAHVFCLCWHRRPFEEKLKYS